MTALKTILAIDDEPNMRRLLEISLRQTGYKPIIAATATEALEAMQQHNIDLVLSDLHMPGMNGLELLRQLREQNEQLPFIIVTAQGDIKTAVDAMKLGATDYILRPFELETLELAIGKALTVTRIQLENAFLKSDQHIGHIGIIGLSPVMQTLKKMIQQVAPEKATVLITGETGTGKELIAKAIHHNSPRKDALFVAVNCAAIPTEIIESELFGHEKGAFTGALKQRIGKFELANGGTIFLDEVTEMPIQLQAKLLRVLQEGVIEKVGGNRPITLDIRVVAATNRQPLLAVKQGLLREDLYYRLNVFELASPPLRDRIGDIILLAQHFAQQRHAELHESALQCLTQYAWPGNVRELENVVERAAILAGQNSIMPQHLPVDITQHMTPLNMAPLSTTAASQANQNTPNYSIPQATAHIERQLILQALEACNGNKSKAAKLLAISERSLWNKLDLYQLR